jgi:response regulator of citrate/malate metabolism
MIRVLVVEDDPVAARAHRSYVERVPGFVVAGTAGTGGEALRLVSGTGVDLVLLDLNLPDIHGLEVCRALQSAGAGVDVIAVTSARDLAAVRAAVSRGVVQYLLKPFTFASMRVKLERYADYRQRVAGNSAVTGQLEVDRVLAALRGVDHGYLPVGLSEESLDRVIQVLRAATAVMTASTVAESCGMSRVTARRYLEHLVESGLAVRGNRHGRSGRPEVEYRWLPRTAAGGVADADGNRRPR